MEGAHATTDRIIHRSVFRDRGSGFVASTEAREGRALRRLLLVNLERRLRINHSSRSAK